MGENVRSSLIRGCGAGVEGQKFGVGLTVLLAQNNSRLDSNDEERSASSLIFGLINVYEKCLTFSSLTILTRLKCIN